jgi:MoxR-like ATPase
LDKLFFVLGTQNPLDIAGTYPLPQVQLDRFLLKLPMSYVDAETETEILENHALIQETAETISPVCSRSELLDARGTVQSIFVHPALRDAIISIVQSTRSNPLIQFGASTRAALMWQEVMKAWALLEGRDFATEDDLKHVAPFVLLHRLRFHGGVASPVTALEELMAPHIENLVRRIPG